MNKEQEYEVESEQLSNETELRRLANKFELGESKYLIDGKNNTLWYTQDSLAKLYECTVRNISHHVKNIFEDGELLKDENTLNPSNGNKSSISRRELKRLKISPKTVFYNQKVMNALGFKINSDKAIDFRKGTNNILEAIRKKDVQVINNVQPKSSFQSNLDDFDQRTSEDSFLFKKVEQQLTNKSQTNLNRHEELAFLNLIKKSRGW